MTAVTLPRPGATLLTDTDRAMLVLLADGAPLKRIARAFNTDPAAVGRWIARLEHRTGTESHAHLVATAVRCGWLQPAPSTVRRAAA